MTIITRFINWIGLRPNEKEKKLMSQFNSPCVDHDNNCSTDLDRLKADLKFATRSVDWGRAEKSYREELRCAEFAVEASREDIKLALSKPSLLRERQDALLAAQAKLRAIEGIVNGAASTITMLCSLRAHHRGRVHGNRRRLPDGTVIEWTKEKQEVYIRAEGGALLARYTRDVPVKA